MNEKELLEIKKRIDAAKTSVARLEGERESILSSLSTQFNCKSLAEAEKRLMELTAEDAKLQKELDEKLAEIEEAYGEIE